MKRKRSRLPLVLLGLYLVVLAWSLIGAREYLIWFLEVLPVLVLLVVLVLTYRKFPLTNLSYVLIFLGSVIVAVGAHYTYENMPLFNWIRDQWDLKRNDYDRFGHFVKGFPVALMAREVLLRKFRFPHGPWLWGVVLSISLAIGAVYELIEFGAAMVMGKDVREFLGTQGDVWDAQWDMLLTLVGSVLALLLLSRRQDRQIARDLHE